MPITGRNATRRPVQSGWHWAINAQLFGEDGGAAEGDDYIAMCLWHLLHATDNMSSRHMLQGQNGVGPKRHIEGTLAPMPKQSKVKLEDASVTERQVHTGLRIKAIRKLAGFNQGPLAELCGTDQSQWSRWEKGERQADVEIMRRFARRAKTSLDLIYDGLPVGTDPTLLQLLRAKIPDLLQPDPTYMDQDTDTAQASYRQSIRRGAAEL